MEIRKYSTPEGHCIIKSNTYVHTFEYIQKLVEIAQGEFPDLNDCDISVKVYNSDIWGKQTGIEFQVDPSLLTPDYDIIQRLPHTFN